MSRLVRFAALIVLAALLVASTSYGVVLQNDSQPTGTAKPSDNVMARWNTWDPTQSVWRYNASAVVVGQPGWSSTSYVITNAHQGGDINSTVTVNGQTYQIESILTNPAADLRLVKLQNAALTDFVTPYTNTNEATASGPNGTFGKDFVLGGFGMVRGTALQSGSPAATYGYAWGGNNDNTNALHWGTNHIDAIQISGTTPGDLLIADFDKLGSTTATAFEAEPALYDSGGGWFIKSGSTWQIAGLTRGVGHNNGTSSSEAWFANPSDPSSAFPDYMAGVRVSTYSDWLSEEMTPEPATMLLLSVGGLLMLKRRRTA